MELSNPFWFTAGVATAYLVPFLWGLVDRLWTDHQHNKTLTHEGDGRQVTEQDYQDLMDSAQDVRNAQRDRDTIHKYKIPHDKVGYCEYQWNPALVNYWCVNHKAESEYITYDGSLLPCKIHEEAK